MLIRGSRRAAWTWTTSPAQFPPFSGISVFFADRPPSQNSVHIPAATISHRLPQHVPAVHHGEHEADHPERLHHLAADAHGTCGLAPRTPDPYSIPSRTTRYGLSVYAACICMHVSVYTCIHVSVYALCACLWSMFVWVCECVLMKLYARDVFGCRVVGVCCCFSLISVI